MLLFYIARLFLAAIHYNTNSTRKQAVTRKGELQWRKSYPRGRGGEAIISPVLTPIKYGEFLLYECSVGGRFFKY